MGFCSEIMIWYCCCCRSAPNAQGAKSKLLIWPTKQDQTSRISKECSRSIRYEYTAYFSATEVALLLSLSAGIGWYSIKSYSEIQLRR